jgi:probable phosphoglycerate mutase
VTTTVFLVRHGTHDQLGKTLSGRMDGVSLSDLGRREAEALAARLRGEGLETVYASPLQRTRETAAPIAAAAGAPLRFEDDLLEVDFGPWSGKAFEELSCDPAWAVWQRDRGVARPPGGETMVDVQARLRRWLDRARAEHPEGRIAAVTHAEVIKALVAYTLGFSLDQHSRLEVSPASLTTIVAGDWGMKVMAVNETIR